MNATDPEQPRSLHQLTVTARLFRRLPWPTSTRTYDRECSCADAEAIARTLRQLGGHVTVHHGGDPC